MDETKPTFASTTIWGALAAVLGAAIPALLTRAALTPADQQAAAAAVGQAISAVGGAVALLGRLRATKRLS